KCQSKKLIKFSSTYFLNNNKYLKPFEDKFVIVTQFSTKLLTNFHDFDIFLVGEKGGLCFNGLNTPKFKLFYNYCKLNLSKILKCQSKQLEKFSIINTKSFMIFQLQNCFKIFAFSTDFPCINNTFNMLRFLCKPHIITARNLTVQTLSRSMAGQAPQKMEDYFKDKKIIVTGSCAGMGEKITERLLDLGAFVYAVVEKEEGAAKALPRTKQIFCDVSNWEDTYKKMYDIGPVHGLVNNAGVAVIESFFDVTENGWNKTLNINARALVRISQAVAKNMIDAGIKGS
ncbi:hypothetical protein AGLY_015425, partial [Aphis glycines]